MTMAKRPALKKSRSRTLPARRASASKKSAGARKTAAGRPAKRAGRPVAATAKARVAPLFAPVRGAERRDIGHVQLEIGRAGAARVKRMIYPAGFHWAADMKPVTGTDLCMHAHVGFLAHGEIHIEYADGCIVEFKAPQVVAIEPGHDGWVVGREPVVLIEIDFERDTVGKLGMPDAHRHD
jgi:hypothetical protein